MSGNEGQAVPRGPTDYPLRDLTWEQFQNLVFLLARAEVSAAVPIRAKDHGLDVRLPDPRGLTLRGWQAKRYTTKINWAACEESVKRALAFWRPPRITFAFPIDLSAGQQKAFRERLSDKYRFVRFDWWGESELQRRIRDTDEGQRAATWLFEHLESPRGEMLRAMASGGPLSDSADAAERVAEVQKFMDRDPHFNYTIVSSSGRGAAAAAPRDALLSVEVEAEGKPITFHASERYPGAAYDSGTAGALIFSDDEAGRQARAAVDQVLREGGTAEISSGVEAQVQDVPVGLRGLMPERSTGAIRVSAGEPTQDLVAPTPGVPILVRAREAEIGMVLSPGKPIEGWERAWVGSAGGLEVFLSTQGAKQSAQSRMDWHWQRGEGTAVEQLLAAEVILSAYRGERIELVLPSNGQVLSSGRIDPPGGVEVSIADLDLIRQFLAFAAEAEAWLGRPLNPPAQPTEGDFDLLGWLIARIRKPKYSGTFKRVRLTLSRELPRGDGPWTFALLQALYGDLFGQQLYLGTELVGLERGKFEEVTGREKPGDVITLVPAEPSAKVSISFGSPVDVPEKASEPADSPD